MWPGAECLAALLGPTRAAVLREGRAVRHSLTALGRTMLGQLLTSPPRGRGLAEVHRHLLDADGAE